MFRLVFNSVGVGVGVVIRSVELNDLVKTASGSAYDSVEYDQVKTGSSELKQEETKPITNCGNVLCDWLILPLLLPTPTPVFTR